jgi:RND superfamily putative drug exporter
MTQWLRGLGARCVAHPLVVIAGWLVAATVLTLLSVTDGGHYSQRESLPGTPVGLAEQRLAQHFPAVGDEHAQVVLHARDGSPATLDANLAGVQAALARLPHVVPASTGSVSRSADGTYALIDLQYDVTRFVLHGPDLAAAERAARVESGVGVDGRVGGDLAFDVYSPATGLGEKVGIGIAVLVLLAAFGSVIAALMPIATAALALTTGIALVRLLSNVYAVNNDAPALATMIGLGVGIDYALFIVTRHREGMRCGLDPQQAATAAAATAGTSVLWAGVTVVAAICGLGFAGIPVITSLGFASAIVVAVSVLSALTVLPALLSLTDVHIDALHIPLPHLRHERVGRRLHLGDAAAAHTDPSVPLGETWWTRWARLIERRPLPFALGSLGVLVVLALPIIGLRLGQPDGGSSPPGTEQHQAYEMVARGFGAGANGPLEVVATASDRFSNTAVGREVAAHVRQDPDIASVSGVQVSPDRRLLVVDAVPRSSPSSAETSSLVSRLRQRLPALESATGSSIVVAGVPGGQYDVAHRVLSRLPDFVGAVLLVSFLLLMLVFRSLLVPLKAVLLNLLSIAAAVGVVVAVFSWGWLHTWFGISETVPLQNVVPMMMFAIVFGLSMDYEVFLLSRVREEWDSGTDSRGSVVRGLAATARVISAAAAIMVCIFLSFTLAGDVVVKMMGLGLAVAVFLDATLIRLILVPATMAMLGDLNWWLPRWLDRVLPHVEVDGGVPVTPAGPEPAAASPRGRVMPNLEV